MKKEEVLKVLEGCGIQNYYVHSDDIMVVCCGEITWRELYTLSRYIIRIIAEDNILRISIGLD